MRPCNKRGQDSSPADHRHDHDHERDGGKVAAKVAVGNKDLIEGWSSEVGIQNE